MTRPSIMSFLNWTRIVNLRNVEAVRWMVDDGEHVQPELLTELVWKPRDDEVILEVEQLPLQVKLRLKDRGICTPSLIVRRHALIHSQVRNTVFAFDSLSKAFHSLAKESTPSQLLITSVFIVVSYVLARLRHFLAYPRHQPNLPDWRRGYRQPFPRATTRSAALRNRR